MTRTATPEELRRFDEATARIAELLGTAEKPRTEPLSDDERKEVDALDREIEHLGKLSKGRKTKASFPGGAPGHTGHDHADLPAGSGFRFITEGGRYLSALTPGEPVARGERVRVGECLRSALTGDTSSLSDVERLAMFGGSDSSGGYITGSVMSSAIVDLARSASVCFKAGAQTLPLTAAETTIARVATDPTAYWRSETVGITATSMTFGRITLRPKTLACIVPVSIELLEDAGNAADVIQQTLQKAMAQKLDEALLTGCGAEGVIQGLTYTSGINESTSVGTPSDYSDVSGAVGDVLTADFPGEISELAWIEHPAIAEVYDNLSDLDGNPMRPTPWASQLRRLYTTAMPSTGGSGQNEHTGIIGHFPQMLVGMRTNGVVIEILREGTVTDADSTSWNATSQLMRHVRAYLRADVAILQPSWFAVLSGQTTT
jgi:HK97 family phage major capsid protein